MSFAARADAERARVDEVIALVGLTPARGKLPYVILLDEPLAAVDALRRLELRAALREIVAASGATAFLVTHDVDEALAVSTRAVVLERGSRGVRLREPVCPPDARAPLVLLAALGVPVGGALGPPGRWIRAKVDH